MSMHLFPLTVAASRLTPRAARMALHALAVAGPLPEAWERTLRAGLSVISLGTTEPLTHADTTGIDMNFGLLRALPQWMSFDPSFAQAHAFLIDVWMGAERHKAEATL